MCDFLVWRLSPSVVSVRLVSLWMTARNQLPSPVRLWNSFVFSCLFAVDRKQASIRKRERWCSCTSKINLYFSCKINRRKRPLEVIESFMLQQQRQGWFGSHNCDHACGLVWACLLEFYWSCRRLCTVMETLVSHWNKDSSWVQSIYLSFKSTSNYPDSSVLMTGA